MYSNGLLHCLHIHSSFLFLSNLPFPNFHTCILQLCSCHPFSSIYFVNTWVLTVRMLSYTSYCIVTDVLYRIVLVFVSNCYVSNFFIIILLSNDCPCFSSFHFLQRHSLFIIELPTFVFSSIPCLSMLFTYLNFS